METKPHWSPDADYASCPFLIRRMDTVGYYKKVEMNKSNLYLIAALIWGIPGILISVKGIRAYMSMAPENLWWLLLVTAVVIAGFYVMFSRIVDKYSTRIASLPQKTNFWQTFPLRGWILVVLMTCLGIVLKHIPGIPASFTASFYSGLGPMLLVASLRFICNRKRA